MPGGTDGRSPSSPTIDPMNDPGKRLRGRRGLLEHLLSMPWDILFAIFSELEPADLLRLSGTNKDFRSFFMSKNSTIIWKAARKNVGLPHCPEDLTELQYAVLAFSNHCHTCTQPSVYDVDWQLRERACKNCAISNKVGYKNRIMFLPSLRCPKSIDLVSILSTPIRGFEELAVFDRRNTRILTDAHVDEFRVKWEDVPRERRNAFVAAHTKRDVEVKTHALLCSDWYSRWEAAQSKLRRIAYRRRFQSILSKLKEIGYYDKYVSLSYRQRPAFRALGVVQRTTPLHDRIWSKIRPEITFFLDECKRQRLAKVAENALNMRFRKLNDMLQEEAPLSRVFAPLEYIVSKPEVRALLDIPHNESLPDIELENLRPLLASWNAQWEEEASERLRDTVRKAANIPEVDTRDPLSLAIGAIWHCTQCTLNIPYPDALVHRCQWDSSKPCNDCNGKRHKEQYLQTLCHYELQHGGARRSWTKLETTAHLLREMLDIYELDPLVSSAYLDSAVSTSLSCPCHMRMNGVRCIMHWRAALNHRTSPFACLGFSGWIKASEAECLVSCTAEMTAMRLAKQAYANAATWRCGVCPPLAEQSSSTWIEVIDHISLMHELADPENHVMQWEHTSCIQDTPVYLVPSEMSTHYAWSDRIERGEAVIWDC